MIPSQKIAINPLRKRREFVTMRVGKRQHATSFLLQMRQRQDSQCASDGMRVGYTVTKKVGNAVERNRIKRRMREAVRIVMPSDGKQAHDYVLIGKRAALNSKFETIVAELSSALKRLHRNSTQSGNRNGQ